MKDEIWKIINGYPTPDAQIYLFGSYRLDFALDKEVEIIEEDKEEKNEKPIQELKNKRFTKNQKQIAGKINELIREVNKLKNE